MGGVCTRINGSSEDIRTIYKIGPLIGSGAFGQVRVCTVALTGEVRAVKVMQKKSAEKGIWSNISMFRREIALLEELDHPNIVRYYDFYEDRHFLYSVMEKCDGGELFERILRINHFNEVDASNLCRQMLFALEYIHQFRIVHRDIKAENFIFTNSSVDSSLVVIDFGMSVRLRHNEMLSDICGSPHYLAPEVLRRCYDCQADMWALGVVLYLMLYGCYPFDGKQTNSILNAINRHPIQWTSNRVVLSTMAIDFVKGLLERDPSRRLTAGKALQHVWITQKRTDAPAPPIPPDILRSAQRRVSMQKTVLDADITEERNRLLSILDQNFEKGYGTGCRHISTLSNANRRPEFRRHNVRVSTTPSCMLDMTTLDEWRRTQNDLNTVATDSSPSSSQNVRRLSTSTEPPPDKKMIYLRPERRSHTVEIQTHNKKEENSGMDRRLFELKLAKEKKFLNGIGS